MTILKDVVLKKKQVSFDGLGEWNWEDDEYVTFVSDDIGLVKSQIPLGFGQIAIDIFHSEGSRCVIGVLNHGNIAWRFDADVGLIVPEALLFGREMCDSGFAYIFGVSIKSYLALIYEGGIICFDSDGKLRWRQNHALIDWKFQGENRDGVEYCDSSGKEWIYNIEDGKRVDLKL